ncbi:SH3 beta-barrel fold-containing protein [Chryseobacterium sp. MHB01]|uniref:SH3 beta-barrel fold-containing protein n=1 Tax=Chryseobacterium sp. MHB01 TaxID=3109433 RepID=UPI002AFE521C|nr:SH3 beta-barrel fold-containing protein [Chryseobacterium sp. MHB01]MEA1848961.1 SH3 beta-barrel fold-containing protein [Chryseobacterium sp. MHB01]
MKTILSTIMKNAWKFFRTTGESFAECLKKAWNLYRLVERMKSGIVKFYFQKVDGSIREAWGTLSPDVIPATEPTENNRKQNETVQVYYDTEAQSFRSFKKLNFVKVA